MTVKFDGVTHFSTCAGMHLMPDDTYFRTMYKVRGAVPAYLLSRLLLGCLLVSLSLGAQQ